MEKYVNVYRANQLYGGPEEGGWWYDVGEAVSSEMVTEFFGTSTFSNTEDVLGMTKYKWQSWCDRQNEGKPGIGSVNCDGWYLVKVQDHIAKNFPNRKPHYE